MEGDLYSEVVMDIGETINSADLTVRTGEDHLTIYDKTDPKKKVGFGYSENQAKGLAYELEKLQQHVDAQRENAVRQQGLNKEDALRSITTGDLVVDRFREGDYRGKSALKIKGVSLREAEELLQKYLEQYGTRKWSITNPDEFREFLRKEYNIIYPKLK
jgi:hypothetical protein